MSDAIVGSFDSLHVNVFTNNIKPETKNSVIVAIQSSSSLSMMMKTCARSYLTDKNFTLVTMNHRLGVFGGLSLTDPDLKVSGDAWLKDQRLALQWVQVKYFIIDPV